MPSIKLAVGKLGFLRDCELDIPVPGYTIFYGSNISGKTLLGLTMSELLSSSSLLAAERLARSLGYKDAIEMALSSLGEIGYDVLDIQHIYSESPENEFYDIVNRTLPTRLGLNGREKLRSYIVLQALSSALLTSYPECSFDMKLSISYDGGEVVRLKGILPLPHPREQDEWLRSVNRVEEIRVSNNQASNKFISAAVLDPYNFGYRAMRIMKGEPLIATDVPFSTKILYKIAERSQNRVFGDIEAIKSYYEPLNRALDLISKTISISSGADRGIKVSFKEWGLLIRSGDFEKFIELNYFSKGLRSLFSSVMVQFLILAASKMGNLIPVVFLDEPEVSLDTYVLSGLPSILKDLASSGSVVISTHREHLISAIEDCASSGISSKLYEFLWDEKLDNVVREAPFDEETGRFDIERILELLPGAPE
jgi:hypothetical protein